MSDKVHPLKKAQIAHLKVDEPPTTIFSKYTNFTDVFSPQLAIELPKYTSINNHAIELLDDRQPLYGPIYILGLVKLEILKAYINNNLTNSFSRSRSIGFGPTTKVFFVYQPEKLSVPSKRGEVFWLYYLSSRHSNRNRINQSHR